MKQTLSIFLLHVMLLVAIQPIVAVHFCGGELYSLSLYENKDIGKCCDSPVKHVEVETCCSMEQDVNQSDMPICADATHANCCDLQTVQLHTDTFQSETNPVNLTKIVHSFDVPWLVLVNLFRPTEPTNNSTILSDAFPADGLFLKDVSIHTFVCTFRI